MFNMACAQIARQMFFCFRRIPCASSLISSPLNLRSFSSASSVLSYHLSRLSIGTSPQSPAHHFHSSSCSLDLMEFFDNKEVWGEASVVTGRPWRVDELRIKSNQDLHKLWYVLLKERNMLLTMEAEYNRKTEVFPNPERIEKVEESMENILQVVQERDNSLSLLETGKSTDPGGEYVTDFLGRTVYRKFKEYAVPPYMNKAYRLLYPSRFRKEHVKYLALYREKVAKRRYGRCVQRREKNKKLVEKFPHLEGKLEELEFEEPKI